MQAFASQICTEQNVPSRPSHESDVIEANFTSLTKYERIDETLAFHFSQAIGVSQGPVSSDVSK